MSVQEMLKEDKTDFSGVNSPITPEQIEEANNREFARVAGSLYRKDALNQAEDKYGNIPHRAEIEANALGQAAFELVRKEFEQGKEHQA